MEGHPHIPSKEALRVEFKSERSGPIDDSVFIANVVAFANTSGGTLYLGVEDDGTVNGKSYTTTLRLLKSMESEGLVRHRGSTRSSEYYV